MKRCLGAGLMLACVLAVLAPRANAQRPPETHPVSEHRDIVMSWDRSAMPGDIELFPRSTVLGYSADPMQGYGRIHLTCRSDSDYAAGRCPTVGNDENGARRTEIPVGFVESRTGQRQTVTFSAALQRAYGDRRCYSDYWDGSDRPISTVYGPSCIDASATGTGVVLEVPDRELARLVAGRWSGELILDLRTDIHSPPTATYSFVFDFSITDYDAISIYFPGFEEVAPDVSLNLRYDPIGQTVGGRALLDMCLYDGLGAQSEYLGITVRDPGARPPGSTGYSVWHRDGGSDDSQRVDYTVVLDHQGSRMAMRNGVEEQLRGIDSARLRLVLLPGMSQPVFCVPTPLTLETPRVPITSKRPGAYRGDLKVELRVPTVRP